MSSPITSINPLAATTQSSNSSVALPTQTLNQQDFLKLLVAQMSSQDPMNPQSNSDFAAQMAQFSALQTAQSTQTSVATLASSQQVQQANDLIGRTVMLQNSDGTTASGAVSAVQLTGGTPQLVVNGVVYSLSQVSAIIPANPTQ